MIHKMNLWNNSFIAIKEVRKTIEMRLNDNKRKKSKQVILLNLLIRSNLLAIFFLRFEQFYRFYMFLTLTVFPLFYNINSKITLGEKYI